MLILAAREILYTGPLSGRQVWREAPRTADSTLRCLRQGAMRTRSEYVARGGDYGEKGPVESRVVGPGRWSPPKFVMLQDTSLLTRLLHMCVPVTILSRIGLSNYIQTEQYDLLTENLFDLDCLSVCPGAVCLG